MRRFSNSGRRRSRQAAETAATALSETDGLVIHDVAPLERSQAPTSRTPGLAPVPSPGAGAEPAHGTRPDLLAAFTGQEATKANLSVFIDAARTRGQPLDHVLLVGPPGLGKTTLARIIAREMAATFKSTSGPVIAKPGDLAAILTQLERGDVLFIDEIHRLPPIVEEILYPAMEDFRLDLIVGEGPGARSVRIELEPFTLVGATTRSGLLTTPLRDRFGIPLRLGYYEPAELAIIVARAATILGIGLESSAASTLAARSRGTPRIANRLLRRLHDFATVAERDTIDAAAATLGLSALGVDELGLDPGDLAYLTVVHQSFGGGPVGIDTIAAALSEPVDALEDIVEPYLIQQGLLQRTPRGRVLTPRAADHLGPIITASADEG